MRGRGKARIVVSAVIGLLPVGVYGLTYFVASEIVGKFTFLLILGLMIGLYAYACPAWDDD